MTDDAKTLGQVAFEALVKSCDEHIDVREWPGMRPESRTAWQAAAEAVAAEVRRLADALEADDE